MFIEVTKDNGSKAAVAISAIKFLSERPIGTRGTSVHFKDGDYLNVTETFNEVSNRVEAACRKNA